VANILFGGQRVQRRCGDELMETIRPSQRLHLTLLGGVAHVHLVPRAEDVAAVLDAADQAGGRLVKPATATPWGVAGYFEDPDGHLFEVDYEPTWVFDATGHLVC